MVLSIAAAERRWRQRRVGSRVALRALAADFADIRGRVVSRNAMPSDQRTARDGLRDSLTDLLQCNSCLAAEHVCRVFFVGLLEY